MARLLDTLRRRLMGGTNPYAGYVEACDEAYRRWALEPTAPGVSLRRHYADYAFQARVETNREVR
jgi:hypothetical protein